MNIVTFQSRILDIIILCNIKRNNLADHVPQKRLMNPVVKATRTTLCKLAIHREERIEKMNRA